MDVNDNISPRGGYYYNNELYYSDAYRSLSKAARDLLHCLLNELRWANNKKKKKRKKVYLNNSNSGGVSFTEVHFKELHGYCSATYLNPRNQLIEVVEETLDNDITRNGNALNTEIIEANTDEGVLFPYGGIRIVVRVLYQFVRGTA